MDYQSYCYLRKNKNVKDAVVARATGISPVVFSEWKKGKSTPKIDKIKKIAEYFGVSADYTIWEEEKPSLFVYPETMLLNDEEQEFMQKYRILDKTDKGLVNELIETMILRDKYKKDSMEGGEVG